MKKIKLLVTRKDGSTQELDVQLPVSFFVPDNPLCSLWEMTDAAGTDYYFNQSDGTYDGWGRAVHSDAEVGELVNHANTTKAPPKIDVQ